MPRHLVPAGHSGDEAANRAMRLLLGIFLIRGLILACVLPPFEGWDEYQHVGYIDYCAHHREPAVYGQTKLDVGYARALAQFPQPIGATPQSFGAQTYEQFWTGQPRPPPVQAPIGFYQSQHPFLYYRLMAPLYTLCGGRENLRLAVSVLRLINLAFGTIAISLVLRWIHRWLPPRFVLIAGCCVIFNPILLLNAVRVSNDALAFALGTGVVVLCLPPLGKRACPLSRAVTTSLVTRASSPRRRNSILRRRAPAATMRRARAGSAGSPCLDETLVEILPSNASPQIRAHLRKHWQTVLLAVLLPLAVLAKATDLTLVPLVILAFGLQLACSQKNKLVVISQLFTAALTFAAFTSVYFADNLHHFGELTPMQEAIANHHAGRTLWKMIFHVPHALWFIWAWCLWVRDALWVGGWSFLPCPRRLVAAYEIVMAAGFITLAIPLIRRRLPIFGRPLLLMLALLVLAHAGLMYHAVESYSAWARHASTNPWYAAVAIPWLMILISCALLSLPNRTAGVTLALCIPIIDLTAETLGVCTRMLPLYYHGATLEQTLSRMSQAHPPLLGATAMIVFLSVLCVLLAALLRRSINPDVPRPGREKIDYQQMKPRAQN